MFSRIWIVQEITVCPNVTVLCGPIQTDVDDLGWAAAATFDLVGLGTDMGARRPIDQFYNAQAFGATAALSPSLVPRHRPQHWLN